VFFTDGSSTEKVSIDYPIGHRRRRDEGIPVLMAKFERAIRAKLPAVKADRLLALAAEPDTLEAMPITELMALFQN